MLTLEQLAAVNHEQAIRDLEHLFCLQNVNYREERQLRIMRIQTEIKGYYDEHK